MRKLSTGEPCTGKPYARFGGRGGFFPTPIAKAILDKGIPFVQLNYGSDVEKPQKNI